MIRTLLVMLVTIGLTGCVHRNTVNQTDSNTVREIVRVCYFNEIGNGQMLVLSPSRGRVIVKLDSLAARLHRQAVMSASVAIDHGQMVFTYDRVSHNGTLMPIGGDSLMCQTFVEDVNVMW